MALTHMQLVKALNYLRPGESWHTTTIPPEATDCYQYLVWDDVTTAPTELELNDAWEIESIREDRRLAYPDIKDQLDSLGKTLKYLKDNGTNIGPDGDAWVAALQAVKTNNPLP